LVDLPISLWNAFINSLIAVIQFVFVDLPDAVASFISAMWDAAVALRDAFFTSIGWIGNRLSTGVTWILAIAISPFYLLWRLGGFGGHEPPPRRPV
jgi:hypothetical protein